MAFVRCKTFVTESFNELLKPSSREVPMIDGLRGMSILLIVLFHSFYGVLFVLRRFEPILNFLNSIPTPLTFVTGSDKAVDIFFVISAFLLGSSIFQKIESGINFNRAEITKFYIKRLFRIYPLFLIGIILYFPINAKQSFRNLPYNLVFLDNFDFKCIIPVGWSLSIEMQFYFILPWLAKFIYRFKENKRILILSTLCLSSVLIAAFVCIIYPEIYQTHFYNFHPDHINPTTMMDRLYYPTHTRFGPLILGLIWAYIHVHGKLHEAVDNFFSQHSSFQYGFIFGGLILMYLMMFFPVYPPQSLYYQHFSPTLNLFLHASHRVIFCIGLLMVVFPVFFSSIHVTPLTKSIKRLLSLSIFRPYSQVVFPIYLFHFPMIALAGLAIFQTTKIQTIQTLTIYDVFKIFTLASVLSLLLGIVLHTLIEKPLIKKGYRWVDHSHFLKGQNSRI